MRVFIDASVLFAASLSATGASREIMRIAQEERITLVANSLVLEEVVRNLSVKTERALEVLQSFRGDISIELIEPTKEEILEVLPFTALKDAPHLAAAKKAGVHCLVSLDRRHMIEPRDIIWEHLRLRILLPAELLQELRGFHQEKTPQA